MILLHLVLAGAFIGSLAHDYDVNSIEGDQSREERLEPRLRKIRPVQVETNLDKKTKSDPFINWFLNNKSHKKHTSATPDVNWYEDLLRHATTENPTTNTVKTTTTPSTTTTPTTPVTPDTWPSDLQRAVEKLVNSVDDLSTILQDIKIRKCQNYLKRTHTSFRSKRDVANTKTTASVVLKSVNDTKNASAPDAGRESNDVPNVLEIQNGRRSGHNFRSVKDKLLLYLDEGFQDIGAKVNSLRQTKQHFANVAPYKIGYIIANVDTLAVSIKNLREEARRNRLLWEEREILDVYDRLKISNTLITNLMDTLRLLMDDK